MINEGGIFKHHKKKKKKRDAAELCIEESSKYNEIKLKNHKKKKEPELLTESYVDFNRGELKQHKKKKKEKTEVPDLSQEFQSEKTTDQNLPHSETCTLYAEAKIDFGQKHKHGKKRKKRKENNLKEKETFAIDETEEPSQKQKKGKILSHNSEVNISNEVEESVKSRKKHKKCKENSDISETFNGLGVISEKQKKEKRHVSHTEANDACYDQETNSNNHRTNKRKGKNLHDVQAFAVVDELETLPKKHKKKRKHSDNAEACAVFNQHDFISNHGLSETVLKNKGIDLNVVTEGDNDYYKFQVNSSDDHGEKKQENNLNVSEASAVIDKTETFPKKHKKKKKHSDNTIFNQLLINLDFISNYSLSEDNLNCEKSDLNIAEINTISEKPNMLEKYKKVQKSNEDSLHASNFNIETGDELNYKIYADSSKNHLMSDCDESEINRKKHKKKHKKNTNCDESAINHTKHKKKHKKNKECDESAISHTKHKKKHEKNKQCDESAISHTKHRKKHEKNKECDESAISHTKHKKKHEKNKECDESAMSHTKHKKKHEKNKECNESAISLTKHKKKHKKNKDCDESAINHQKHNKDNDYLNYVSNNDITSLEQNTQCANNTINAYLNSAVVDSAFGDGDTNVISNHKKKSKSKKKDKKNRENNLNKADVNENLDNLKQDFADNIRNCIEIDIRNILLNKEISPLPVYLHSIENENNYTANDTTDGNLYSLSNSVHKHQRKDKHKNLENVALNTSGFNDDSDYYFNNQINNKTADITDYTDGHLESIADHTDENLQSITDHTDENLQSITDHTDENLQSITDHTDENLQSITDHTDENLQSITDHTDENLQSSTDKGTQHSAKFRNFAPYERIDTTYFSSDVDCSEDPVDFEVPPLHKFETVHRLTEEQKDDLQGVLIKTGKFTAAEDKIIQKNFEDFIKKFGVSDAFSLLGIGRYGKDIELLKFLKAKHFYVRLAKGLDDRSLNSVYKRARIILHPFRNSGKLTEKEVDHLKRLHVTLSKKWQQIGDTLGNTAERSAEAYRWHKKDIAKGKFTEEEETQLIEALKTISGSSDISFKNMKGINWDAVALHVPSRNSSQCRMYWANNLAWASGSAKKKWNKQCASKLVHILKEFNVDNSSKIDWHKVYESFEDFAPSDLFVHKRWLYLRSQIPDYKNKSFRKIIELLCNKYLKKDKRYNR